MPTKLDYSRLLDDEFLNRGERVRVRAVTLGSAQVLGSDSGLGRLRSRTVQCAILMALLTMLLTVGLYLFTTLILMNAHHRGVHLQVLGLLSSASASATPQAASLSAAPLPADDESTEINNHLNGTQRAVQSDIPMPDRSQDALHDHDHHDHDENHAPHPHTEDDAHLLAMTGHHKQVGADDHDEHQDGEHAHPGDVILGDHHIVPADDVDPTEYTLLLCLPRTAQADEKPGLDPSPGAGDHPAAALNLTRAQRDVLHSTVEFLASRAQCHVVVLRGVNGEVAQGEAKAAVRAAASNATAVAAASGPLSYFSRTGCGASSEDHVDDTAGAEYGGELVLPTGRSLPVVFWDADELFARSPLAARWRGLRTAGRARGTTSVMHSTGSDLLDLAARLQLLWRFGGVTVNLHASADQVLKTLSAFNRTDTQHVYLETTMAALVAAPQTCNAVVFELIRAVSNGQRAPGANGSEEHEHYDEGDLRVFDGVLDDYCRRQTRSTATGERVSSPAPTSTSSTASSPESAEDKSSESASAESDSAESTSAESEPDSTTTTSKAAKMGRMSFRMLRAGRPAVTTTTPGPHPLPEAIRVDTTRCRNNLVTISLA